MFDPNINKVNMAADNAPLEGNKSKFAIKSIGRAAANIDDATTILEVISVEDAGYSDGEITDGREKLEAQGVDQDGTVWNVAIETSNTIKAEWLPFNTNRFTVPNVRRGERVLLWQYGDNDKYYWTTMGLDDHLRRLETATFVFSNTKDESVKKLSPKNSYYFEVSTHTKQMTIGTSNSDGEKHTYVAQINTKDSLLTLTDDIDNFIQIDSNNNAITLHNGAGTMIQLKGDTINITAKTLNVNVGKTNFNSNTAFKGSLTSNGKNVSDSHTHGGVSSGPSKTGAVS